MPGTSSVAGLWIVGSGQWDMGDRYGDLMVPGGQGCKQGCPNIEQAAGPRPRGGAGEGFLSISKYLRLKSSDLHALRPEASADFI